MPRQQRYNQQMPGAQLHISGAPRAMGTPMVQSAGATLLKIAARSGTELLQIALRNQEREQQGLIDDAVLAARAEFTAWRDDYNRTHQGRDALNAQQDYTQKFGEISQAALEQFKNTGTAQSLNLLQRRLMVQGLYALEEGGRWQTRQETLWQQSQLESQMAVFASDVAANPDNEDRIRQGMLELYESWCRKHPGMDSRAFEQQIRHSVETARMDAWIAAGDYDKAEAFMQSGGQAEEAGGQAEGTRAEAGTAKQPGETALQSGGQAGKAATPDGPGGSGQPGETGQAGETGQVIGTGQAGQAGETGQPGQTETHPNGFTLQTAATLSGPERLRYREQVRRGREQARAAYISSMSTQVWQKTQGLPWEQRPQAALEHIKSITRNPQEQRELFASFTQDMKFQKIQEDAAMGKAARELAAEASSRNMLPGAFAAELSQRKDIPQEVRTAAIRLYRGDIRENAENRSALVRLREDIDDARVRSAAEIEAYGFNHRMTEEQIKSACAYLEGGGKMMGLTQSRLAKMWQDATGTRAPDDLYDWVKDQLRDGKPPTDKELEALLGTFYMQGITPGSGILFDGESYLEALKNRRGNQWLPDISKAEYREISGMLRERGLPYTMEEARRYKKYELMGLKDTPETETE